MTSLNSEIITLYCVSCVDGDFSEKLTKASTFSPWISEKGVSLGFNQLGISKGKTNETPIFIAMREIAETCPNFDDGIPLMKF